MILFVLKCTADHRFEAWFRNGAAYEAQAEAHAIACPVCGDTRIGKAPMAPRISKGRSRDAVPDAPREIPSREAQAPVPAAAPAPVPAAAPAVPSLSAPADPAVAEMMRQLGELRQAVEKNCDYVGDRFAEEARRIHYGEAGPRPIYGEASAADAEELREEGVTFYRIPWLPRTNS